jgi:signal transduction histidine kinase
MGLIAGVIAMAIAVVRREEELHRLRSDLISGVSHELRTPLAQIRMFAETLLLGRTRTEAERRRSLEVIDQEAKRLSHFVENMLQFAKGEGGSTRLVPEHSSFAVEIRRAVESFAPMCQARGVEVRTELEEGVTAPVDRSALRRVMLNLMENALKYGPDEQRITVGTALFNDVVRVWVDDEGEGIPRADRERVFDSFYRLNRELDRRVTGSGIGLAVVRQLATLHGGRAWAEEAPGGGARLVVEFPEAYVRAPEENTGTGWAVA